MAVRSQGNDLILDTGDGEVAKLVTGAVVTITLADGVTPAVIYAAATGSTTVGQPLTTRHGVIITGAGAEWYLDPGVYVRHAIHPDGRVLAPLRILVPDAAESRPNEMTIQERKAFAQSIVPLSRGVDPVYQGLIGDPLDLSLYGAPASGKILWPDGSYGKFTAVTIGGGGGANPSTVEEYTVTHRAQIDTSKTDRTAWAPAVSSYTPPSDAQAAALVTRVPENMSTNTARNAYVPSDAELAAFMAARPSLEEDNTQNPYLHFVTGRPGIPNPTTDELIQWVSHKWGIPTNNVRAQMHLESKWSMDMLGDRWTQDDAAQALTAPAYARVAGTNDVFESLGISQLRWHPLHVGSGIFNPHPGTDPLRWQSTAFNLDYYGAVVRYFLDDPEGRRTNWGDGSYVRADYANVQGGWFNPYPWHNAPMMGYVASIASRLIDKPWLMANFADYADAVTVFHQPLMTRNIYGFITGRPEVVVEAWVPPSAPTAAPVGVVAVGGDTTITVNWAVVPPANNGGDDILGYVLTEHDEGWSVTHGFNTGSFTFSGLTNGVPHRFDVAAFNSIGTGPVSAPSNSATPSPATAPDAPTAVSGTPGDSGVQLSWAAPAWNGGSPITSYTITPYIAGAAQTPIVTGSAATTRHIVGLTNGTAYTFKVSATNTAGTGVQSSASSAITPTPPPGPTTAVFSEDFESGTLSNWGSVELGTITNSTSANHDGTHGMHVVSTGSGALIRRTQPSNLAADTVVEAWIRMDAIGAPNTILWARDETGGTLWILTYDAGLHRYNLIPFHGDGSGATAVFTPTGSAPIGEWHHVRIRFNADTTGVATLILDGGTLDEVAVETTGDFSRTNQFRQLQVWLDNGAGNYDLDQVVIRA